MRCIWCSRATGRYERTLQTIALRSAGASRLPSKPTTAEGC